MQDRLTRIVAPRALLNVQECQEHLRVSGNEQTLLALIAAATGYVDGPRGIGVALLTQEWRLSLDRLPNVIRIPLGPVQSVESITYTDLAGDVQTLSTDLYVVDLDSDPARIFRKPNATFPSVQPMPGSVKVCFTCGYGDSARSVPADLRHAVMMLVAHLHENREAASPVKLEEAPLAVSTILNRYRVAAVA